MNKLLSVPKCTHLKNEILYLFSQLVTVHATTIVRYDKGGSVSCPHHLATQQLGHRLQHCVLLGVEELAQLDFGLLREGLGGGDPDALLIEVD